MKEFHLWFSPYRIQQELRVQIPKGLSYITVLVLTIFALLMDGYYVIDNSINIEKAQGHSAECQNALSHKGLIYLSTNCADILNVTMAKLFLTLHTGAAISFSDIKQVSVFCQPIGTPAIPFAWHEWCIW
jgi:hypothetical protein